MDVFRFAKLPMRANDPTRRYRIVREPDRQTVGELEVGGDAPDGDSAVLTVTCGPSLSDAAREDALGTARRFLAELAAGWGVQVAEEPGGAGWEGKADGGSRIRLAYRVVCESP
jgi:hypothetical protein